MAFTILIVRSIIKVVKAGKKHRAEQNGEDYVETDCCGRTKEDKAREKEEKRARGTARKEEKRLSKEQKRMEKQRRKEEERLRKEARRQGK